MLLVAGQTFLHEIIHSLEDIANSTISNKIAHYQIAYKRTLSHRSSRSTLTTMRTAFLSIFNMTNIRASTPTFPNPEGIVNYASIATFELRANMANTGYDGQLSPSFFSILRTDLSL